MKKFCIMILSLLAMCTAMAQQRTSVSGKVVDEAGEPLPGASVTVPGTTQGVTSDVDGNFVLTVTSDVKQLSINYIGFKTRTVDVPK